MAVMVIIIIIIINPASVKNGSRSLLVTEFKISTFIGSTRSPVFIKTVAPPASTSES